MAKTIDIPNKFWRDWLKAKHEKRIELVSNMHIVTELTNYRLKAVKGLTKKHVRFSVAIEINEYFQDLEQTIHVHSK